MEIKTHADNSIELHEPLVKHVESEVKNALDRFSRQITSVVVHLSDSKDSKSTDGDHRCMMEARLEGLAPIAVNDHAVSTHAAVHGAAEKLKRSITSTLGKLQDSAKGAPRVGEVIAQVSDTE